MAREGGGREGQWKRKGLVFIRFFRPVRSVDSAFQEQACGSEMKCEYKV